MSAGRPRVAEALAAVGRAVAAATALAGLAAGVPFILLTWGRWPITGIPTMDQVRDLPTAMASDEAILGLVTVVLWACWALFVASVLAEVAASLRGRGATPPRLGGPVQRLASYLVGSLAISLGSLGAAPAMPAAGAAPAPATPPTAAPTAETAFGGPATTGLPSRAQAAHPAAGQAPQTGSQPAPTPAREITVAPGDSPWSLAAAELGDGARWREIWTLNRDRPQPGGARWSSVETAIQPGWRLALPAAGSAAAPAGQELPAAHEVVVQPGDSFWELAEGELRAAWGRQPTDAEVAGYWRDYVAGNQDRLLPPHDPDLIYPGQTFLAPPPPSGASVAPQAEAPDPQPAAPGGSDPAASPATGGTSTPLPESPPPVSGDEAGEPPLSESPPSAEAGDGGPVGTGVPAPPPAEPGGGHGAEPPAQPAEPGDGGPVGTGVPAPPEPAEGSPVGTDEPVPQPTEPGGGHGAEPPAESTGPGTGTGGLVPPEGTATTGGTADRADGAEGGGASMVRPVGLVGGGLAVVGVLVLLERRRRVQQRHRGRGRDIALPGPDLQPAEAALRAGADVGGAALLDLALRAAATGAAGLPPLRWVEVGPDAVTLVLAAPAPPPPGFTATAEDRWLTRGLPESLAVAASDTMAPAPTLIPLGATADGTELLVELETRGVVSIEGPRDEVVGLLRVIAVAAATPPWGEESDVLLVGLNGELATLPGVKLTTLEGALDAAETRVDQVEAALRSARCPGLAEARAAGVTPDQWAPLVVISATPPRDDGERRRLVALAERPGRAVAVVLPGAEAGGMAVGRRFTITGDGWLLVDGVEAKVLPHRLDDEDAEVVGDLVETASRHEDVPRPERPEAPGGRFAETQSTAAGSRPGDGGDGADRLPASTPEADDGDGESPDPEAPAGGREPSPLPGLDVLMGEVDVLVRVLGEVDAVRYLGPGAAQRLTPTRQIGLEAVAYLASRATAVDREDLESSLYPSGANATKTIYNAISSARALVGPDLFPSPTGGRYQLSPRVATDYELFCNLVDQAEATESPEVAGRVLTDALGLVRGEPFTGQGRGYAWVGPHRGMIVGPVVDAAEQLAEMRLAAGDWRGAEWAARQGLLAFPADERLYRMLMRAAAAAGNVPGVHRVFRELRQVLADSEVGVEPEDTLHPETVELLEQLTGRRRQDPPGA